MVQVSASSSVNNGWCGFSYDMLNFFFCMLINKTGLFEMCFTKITYTTLLHVCVCSMSVLIVLNDYILSQEASLILESYLIDFI